MIQGTHTFFQAWERLIDLGTLSLSVFVIALAILRSLTASQVDKQELVPVLVSLLLDFDLCDGMTSARCVIVFCGVNGPILVVLLDQIEDVVVVVNKLFLESGNLDCVQLLLAKLQLTVFVEKIVDLAAADLTHGHRHGEISLVILPAVDATLKQIFDSDAQDAVRCSSLARAGLSMGKNGHCALIEHHIEDGPHLGTRNLCVPLTGFCDKFRQGFTLTGIKQSPRHFQCVT